MGKLWSHEKQDWVEQTAWCPQCRSVHVLLRAKHGEPKLLCPVSYGWRWMHNDEKMQEWRIELEWASLDHYLSSAEAIRRRLDAPMHTVTCPDCHTPRQSYDSTGTQCVNCSMERE